MLKDVTGGIKKSKTAYVLTALVIVVVVAVILYNIYKSAKIGANAVGQAIGNETIAIQTGIPVARVVYIRSEGNRLWRDGVASYYLWPRAYNEAMFIQVINSMVAPKEVLLLDQCYQEASGERLKDAIAASFTELEKKKLNPTWFTLLST